MTEKSNTKFTHEGESMHHILILGLLGCSETKTEESSVEDSATTEAVESAYGDCSLELVTIDGYTYTASSIGASSVIVHFAYIDDEYGLQEEDHPLESSDSGRWSLELERVFSPEDVVFGQSTMWAVTGFTSGDKIFLGLTEEGEVCDCWDTNAYEVVLKDCSAFVPES